MIFASIPFIFYFLPLVLLLYLACEKFILAKNVLLLAVGLVFYSWGEPAHLIPLLILIVGNYLLGLALTDAKPKGTRRKRIVFLAFVLNLGVMAVARHGNTFFLPLLDQFFGVQTTFRMSAAPLGVAFFSLQALSYIFNVARRKTPPEKNILNVALFISFMPTVLAGPVIDYRDMAEQLRSRKTSLALFGSGCERFIVGFAKLVIVGVPLYRLSEDILHMSAAGAGNFDVPVVLAWLGFFALALRYYFVFSAYSDMAVGLAGMFGFHIKKNFNYPFTAHTIGQFWTRWNILLYRWFYRYIFLSMGGARPKRVMIKGLPRQRNYVLRNLVCFWLLFGLWHGFDWPHLLWGVWFFFFALVEWIIKLRWRDTRSIFWQLYTLFVVSFSFVFLRCVNIGEAMNYLGNLLGVNGGGFYGELTFYFIKENWAYLLAGIFCFPIGRKVTDMLKSETPGGLQYVLAVGYPLLLAALFFLSMVFLSRVDFIPFIF